MKITNKEYWDDFYNKKLYKEWHWDFFYSHSNVLIIFFFIILLTGIE